MTARGRGEEIIPLLRRLTDADDPEAHDDRPMLQQLLADQLAGRDQWPEVLELLKNSERWPKSWLARQLGRLGKVDHLRRLAKGDNHQARVELVDLLLAQGHVEEAMAFLRTLGGTRDRWVSRRLAALLAERGELAELHTRIVTGDYEAAQVLVEHAYRGQLPDAEQLLATGLAPDS
jgi:hypothetical protein